MTRLIIEGIEYDSVDSLTKAINRVPVLPFIELQEQAGIDPDALDEKRLPWRTLVAAWAFLLRRSAGEKVTFAQVAETLVPEDVVFSDDEDETEGDDKPSAAAGPTDPDDSSPT